MNFYLLDSMPGSGKTEFFITNATQLLKASKPEKVILYVAPTLDLLAEAYIRLHEKVGAAKMLKSTFVLSDTRTTTFQARLKRKTKLYMQCRDISDSPSVAINYLLGNLSAKEYSNILYKPDHLRKSLENLGPVSPGSVIFATHECFLRVNRIAGKGSVMSLTEVYFDEARHCILENAPIKFSKLGFELFKDTFESVESGLWANEKRNVEWRLRRILDAPTKVQLLGVAKSQGVAHIPEDVLKLQAKFVEYSLHGRASMFLLTSTKVVKGKGLPSTQATMYAILRPTRLFDGYGKVILSSAFFTDSQMYHFLKKDGHTFESLLETPKVNPMSRSLLSIKARDQILRSNTKRRLHVAALMQNAPTRNVLTKGLLTRGMVIPTKLREQVQPKVLNHLRQADIPKSLIQRNPVTVEERLDKKLRPYAIPPLWVLLYEAARIIKQWRLDHNNNEQALLITNVDRKQTWIPNGAQYAHLLREAFCAKDGELTQAEADRYSPQELHQRSLLSTKWRSTLYKIGKLFRAPRSPKLHGLNSFSDINAFVHIAALNPDPHLLQVYKILIPKYVVEQDHVVENVVQTLYRTSLRDPKASVPVLMVTPYYAIGDFLADKIYGKSKTDDARFEYYTPFQARLTAWDYRKQLDTKTAHQRATKASKVAGSRRQCYAKGDTVVLKKVRALTANIHRTRLLIERSPMSELEDRLDALLAAREALKFPDKQDAAIVSKANPNALHFRKQLDSEAAHLRAKKAGSVAGRKRQCYEKGNEDLHKKVDSLNSRIYQIKKRIEVKPSPELTKALNSLLDRRESLKLPSKRKL